MERLLVIIIWLSLYHLCLESVCQYIIKVKQILYIKIQLMKFYTFLYCKFKFNL